MGKGRTFTGRNTAGLAFLPCLHIAPKTLPQGLAIGVEQPINRPFGIDDYKARYDPDGSVEAPMASGWYGFFGDKGTGKSLTAKVYATLGSSLQMFDDNGQLTDARVHVHNRKSDETAVNGEAGAEWAALMLGLGAKTYRLDQLSFSMLDPEVGVTANFAALIDYIQYLTRQQLNINQLTALRIATHRIQQNPRMPYVAHVVRGALRTLTREDIRSFNDTMDEAMRTELEDLQIPEHLIAFANAHFTGADVSPMEFDSILGSAAELANVLSLVLNGTFGNMFAGTTTYTDVLRERALIQEYGLMTPRQIGLLELMRTHSTRYAAIKGDTSVAPHISIEEEIHLALQDNIELLRLLANESSTARANHEQRYVISQYPNNLLTGDIGTAEYNLSRQLISGFDMFVIGQLPFNTENVEALRLMRISESLIGTMTGQAGSLSPGTMLFAPKNHPPHLVNVIVSDEFLELFGKTRSAPARQVTNRRHVEDYYKPIPAIEKR